MHAVLGIFGLVLFCTACGAQAPKRPNVLLISLDSTRRDSLHVYGYKSPHAPGISNTPNLDSLAAAGVVMEEAYSTTSWTLPSHVTMLRGEPAVVHGVDLDHQRPNPKWTPLPEILRDAGYRTAGFFSGPYLETHFGFDQGFDRYEACYGEVSSEGGQPGGDNTHRMQSSQAITDAVLAEVRSAAGEDEPFFVFAHYFDPHYDYIPPAPFDTRFDPDYAGGGNFDDFLNNVAISRLDKQQPFRRERLISDRDLEHVRALYAGELAWTDSELGRILDLVDELNLTDDTLVIVTADHGDEFFEHQSLGHRSTLFEEQVQVPMILRFPGQLPPGTRVRGLVSTADILPTVLELLDLDAHRTVSTASFASLATGDGDASGRSVLGRIVRHSFGLMRLGGESGVDAKAMRLTLLETYREGPIKITRERNWAILQDEVSPAQQQEFDDQATRVRAQERLRWIDLQRFPQERAQQHSANFSEPRAAAALHNFQQRYRELLGRRSGVQAVEDEARAAQASALEALGYAGSGLGAGAAESQFVFPPPGE